MNDPALASAVPASAAASSGGIDRAYRALDVIMFASGATREEIRAENRGGIGDRYHEEDDGPGPTPARIFSQTGILRAGQPFLSR